MQTSKKTSSDTKFRKEKKDEPKKPTEEKLKKSVYTVSTTPREYVSKTSASDIYTQKKKVGNAPKKAPGVSSTSNASPMKGLLKSSASSISQLSRTSERTPPKKLEARNLFSARSESKTTHSARKSETSKKKELFTNVTVNSPVVKRKSVLNSEHEIKKDLKAKEVGGGEPRKSKEVKPKEVSKTENVKSKERGERPRTHTRTLDESEVKILTVDNVDNNAEMLNLSKKLVAKPKAFYVELDGDGEKAKIPPKKEISDEEEVSYEDDFESYESDFDSYHSDVTEASKHESGSEGSSDGERSEKNVSTEGSLKEKEDERMLDSGNFDLHDQRSGKTKPTAMDFILEDTEKLPEYSKKSLEDTKKSLDEGFQDMSSSSSIRTVDVLDRPLFIDFSKSKQNKLRKKINDRLNQRARDLLAMITLHEMTYSLYEMQPISYDLYMATFGRSNYTQSGVQTFDDGITEEIQTDEVVATQKWTQHPIEFSKNDIFQNTERKIRKYSTHTEDYLTKFTFLIKENYDDPIHSEITADENYKENPLRIFFEQKDGVGRDEMLPYEKYKTKLKNKDYNAHRLSRFLKKFESKVSHILSKNTGTKDLTGLEKVGKLPFSKGHITISPKSIEDSKFDFLKSSSITKLFYSENKSNLLMTAHKNAKGVDGKKSLVCLWDLSVAREPIKVLLAIDDIAVGKFRGSTDGIFVGALEDGSIHLWDLSEEPSWHDCVASASKSAEIVEIENERATQIEKDREWNLRNSQVGLLQLAIVYSTAGAKICYKPKVQTETPPKTTDYSGHYPRIPFALQSCAYTNSASNIHSTETSDSIVGLEMMASQIVSLQRIGILTIWLILHEKKPIKDIGKAFWSKMRLEKHQTINLSDHIDSIQENIYFNLNSAKKRITQRKQDKITFKKESSRPKSSKFEFDIDRPYSAASLRKKVLPVEINVPKSWENGIVCNDLRIINLNDVNSFLVAKNNGEVLCCRRCLGVLRIERFSVATDTSSITSLDVSSEGIPYFLAASDAGAVSLCSLLEYRVLLTLDCRNIPSAFDTVDKCQADHKGRFLSSANAKSLCNNENKKIEITSVRWSRVNHCCIYILLRNMTLVTFDLTHSDMCARAVSDKTASSIEQSANTLALLTPEGEVQIHRLANEDKKEYLHVFHKYVALL